jgi:hypothetical protein
MKYKMCVRASQYIVICNLYITTRKKKENRAKEEMKIESNEKKNIQHRDDFVVLPWLDFHFFLSSILFFFFLSHRFFICSNCFG